MPTDLAALENLFLGLADKTRLRLLALMAAGPVSVGHLVTETGESQPKISRHLAYLRNAGLVDAARDGKWIYYGVAELRDSDADAVFKCVVDELSGKPSQPKTPRKRETRAEQPMPMIVSDVRNEPAMQYIPPENTSYEEPETELEWTHPSDEPHEVLDVFLL